MNYDVPSCRNLRPVAPQNFTNAAFDAIPHNRAAKSFLNADPEAAGAAARERFCGGTFVRRSPLDGLVRNRWLRTEENGKLRARAAMTCAVYGFEFHALQQTHGAGKTLPQLACPSVRRVRIFRWA